MTRKRRSDEAHIPVEHSEELCELLLPPRVARRRELHSKGVRASIVTNHGYPAGEASRQPADFDLGCKIADLYERAVVLVVAEVLSRHLDLVERLVLVLYQPVAEIFQRMAFWFAVEYPLVSVPPLLELLHVLPQIGLGCDEVLLEGFAEVGRQVACESGDIRRRRFCQQAVVIRVWSALDVLLQSGRKGEAIRDDWVSSDEIRIENARRCELLT